MESGPLASPHGAPLGCVWSRRRLDVELIWEYIEWTVADSRQGMFLKLG